MHSGHGAQVSLLPRTQLGRWAVALAVAFAALVLVGTVVPRGGGLALVCGLLGGALALVAIVRDGERALTVLAALAPLAFGVAFVVAELVAG
jgi:hypothetical protein